MMRNAWICDDAATGNRDTWYLIDGDGNMVSAELVQDGTGNFYSLETEHNGHYGMLRYQSATYEGIPMVFETGHNGSFAAIRNVEAVEALRARYGVTSVADINNNNIVYTSMILNGKPIASGEAVRSSVTDMKVLTGSDINNEKLFTWRGFPMILTGETKKSASQNLLAGYLQPGTYSLSVTTDSQEDGTWGIIAYFGNESKGRILHACTIGEGTVEDAVSFQVDDSRSRQKFVIRSQGILNQYEIELIRQ